MLKTRIYTLSALLIASIASVVGLYLLSNIKDKKSNNFIRVLPPSLVVAENLKNIRKRGLYIAGYSDGYIFLGNKSKKEVIFKLKLTNLDTTTEHLVFSGNKISNAAFFNVNSYQAYVMDGLRGKILMGSVDSLVINKSIPTPMFTSVVPLSKTSFLFSYINRANQNTLGKLQSEKNSFIVKDKILKRQVDGLFCTDGIFLNTPNYSKVFFIYRYRNQFIATDTNLNVLYSAKTIDTVSHAKIKVGRIESKKEVTLSAPPVLVNYQASVNNQFLFIRSALKADNETEKIHKKAAAIDVYATKNGKYQFSFYLPDFLGENLSDFKVYDRTFVALFGSYVYTFKLSF